MRIHLLAGIFLVLLSSCASKQIVNPAHLERLYDEVSIGDTRIGSIWIYCEAPDYHLVADEDEGFTCVDDVARALVFFCRQYAVSPDTTTLQKIRSLTEFVLYMQAENGYFYNFMFHNRQINTTHQNSVPVPAFWAWRAFWALSELNLLETAELAELQLRSRSAMERLIENARTLCAETSGYEWFEGIKVPSCIARRGGDQAGVLLIALSNYYQKYPSDKVKTLMLDMGSLLLETQYGNADTPPYFAFFSWQNYWHAWGNAQAYSLLRMGRQLNEQRFIQAALNEIRHFYPYVLQQGFLHEMKAGASGENDGIKLEIKQFPQIAYNVRPMIFAALEAYDLTGDPSFLETARQLAHWFSGDNPARRRMYDPKSGRTYDGIGSPKDINLNSGAESTIEALLSLQALQRMKKQKR